MTKPTAARGDSDTPAADPAAGLCVCVLASGSKGNAVYVSDGRSALLFDAGLSGRELERRMASRGLSPASLDAIVLSHEHADHVKGVGVLSRRFKLPVYMTPHTRRTAAAHLGPLAETKLFECGRPLQINSLSVHPFSISHDAADPAGFTVRQNGKKIGIATDLGTAPAMVQDHLKHCDLLVLEANHDATLLLEGPYPWYLKQRIKSRTGHLSNDESRTLLKSLIHDRLAYVVLAHLSEINNAPDRALSCVGAALAGCRARLAVARQDGCTPLYQVR